jgi:hypothetical protein
MLRSSFWLHEQGDTGKNPLVGVSVLGLHLEPCGEDVSGTSGGGGVHGALVHTLNLLVCTGHGSNVDDGHDGVKILKLHLSEVALFSAAAKFPTSTFEEEAVNVTTYFSELGEISLILAVEHLGHETHVIERELCATGSDLHNSGQVGHRVEKS